MRIRTAVLLLPVLAVALGAQQSAPVAPPPPAAPACPEMATALTALMRNDVRLRDWQNLARYRDANAALGAPANQELPTASVKAHGMSSGRHAAATPAQSQDPAPPPNASVHKAMTTPVSMPALA